AKLDEMFISESYTTGRHQVDITGLIGQYAHGNEPSHHVAYLYNFVNKPEKTKEKVHFILDNFYKNDPVGLIGNEDCGQMSAWYVLSSMGIYQVTPGKKYWSTSIPIFGKVIINLDFLGYPEKRVIDKPFEKTYSDIGFEQSEIVTNILNHKKIVIVPVIEAKSKAFKDSMEIDFKFKDIGGLSYRIIKSLDQDIPFVQFRGEKVVINESSTVEAKFISYNGDMLSRSNTISATFFKKPNNFTIDIKSTYNPQYHAGGSEGLIDGIFGTENWRKGDWQGYQAQDFEAVIDMQSTREITQITANFLQDTRSWILMPTKVEYYVSDDNLNFTLFDTQNNTIDPKDYSTIIKGFKSVKKPVKARYVKVKAANFGKLPDWHQGFPSDGDAFIFIDEITID
ncbi:MAG: glycoside hydrolase domain-containing protein, partial [Flavobacterium sp.]